MKLRHVFLYIVVVSIAVLSSNIAWAQTSIIGCTKITQPGSYVLKNNITATAVELKPTWIPGYSGCIVIAADFVTINLSGYLITGPGGFSVAIAQDTITRIGDVVQSGSITGFSDGVGFAGTAHTIEGVNASSNGDAGIYLKDGGNRVISNTANNNGGYGIYVTTCPNLLLENAANGNGGTNIREPVGCTDNRQENVPKP